jgi:hypothetical protein
MIFSENRYPLFRIMLKNPGCAHPKAARRRLDPRMLLAGQVSYPPQA